MLTAAAGGGLLAVLELALGLVGVGFGLGFGLGDELCDEGAPALELCAALVGAEDVCDGVRLLAGVLRTGWCAGDVRGAPLVCVGNGPVLPDDCRPSAGEVRGGPGGTAADEVTAMPAIPAEELDRATELRAARLAVVRADELPGAEDDTVLVRLADGDVLCTGSATLPMVNGGWCWPASTMTIPATTNASTIASATRDC